MKTSSIIRHTLLILTLATGAGQSQTLFTTISPEPANTVIRSDGPYTVGNIFTVASQNLVVNQLGVMDVYGTGFYASSVQVGLWSGDGATLLASATVSSSDPLSGGYRYHALSPSVTLKAGASYLIGARVGASIAYFLDAASSNLLSANPAVLLGDARYDGGGGFVAPTNVGSTGSRWAAVNAGFANTAQPLTVFFTTNSPLPSGTTIRQDGPFTVGNAFKVAGSGFSVVDKLGAQDVYGTGFYAGSVQVGLWSGDGSTLLASASVSSTDPLVGGYRYHALASPVALSAGVTYLIGAEVGSAIAFFYDSWNNAFARANAAITLTDCRYHSGSSLAAPTSSGGGSSARWAPANASVIPGGYSTTITPATSWGTWDGWGVSLGWWANVFGTRDDLADIVFTTNYTTLNGFLLPGLGMNIARFNAGGCGTNTIGAGTNAISMRLSPNMPAFAQIRGYWLNWDSIDPASASWNWSADANQRAMLLKAKARGANLLELFSNSPMWWMCYNHCTSGADNGANDNLQSWDYDTHAMYLATIAKYAQTNWGVTFDSVEPFNEPDGTWGTTNGPSEACHYNNSTQASVIGYLRSELDSRGLTSVKVAASDASSCDPARTIWNSFSSTTKGQVAQVNTHGYGYTAARRDLLYAAVAGKRLWQSETGDNDTSGMSMVTNLNLDFAQLHLNGWCYWQPLDGSGWGLIQSSDADAWIGAPNRKHFVLAQYSRHIRQGMTIIGSGDANTVAAYNSTNHTLVLVTANYGAAQWITYNLANFSTATGPAQPWTTVTGPGPSYQPGAGIAVNQRVFSAYFPSNTVQTFQVQNVTYP